MSPTTSCVQDQPTFQSAMLGIGLYMRSNQAQGSLQNLQFTSIYGHRTASNITVTYLLAHINNSRDRKSASLDMHSSSRGMCNSKLTSAPTVRRWRSCIHVSGICVSSIWVISRGLGPCQEPKPHNVRNIECSSCLAGTKILAEGMKKTTLLHVIFTC